MMLMFGAQCHENSAKYLNIAHDAMALYTQKKHHWLSTLYLGAFRSIVDQTTRQTKTWLEADVCKKI